jgi:glycosyltransferase involved in cell wall biosynthesis
MLERCLQRVGGQKQRGFTHSVVVVDNDVQESARAVVEALTGSAGLQIVYLVEAEPNISRARNKAVKYATGDYVAFIDDDEFPEAEWLLNLHAACQRFAADGVLGPVLPFFEGSPPEWLVKSELCARRSFQTGTPITNPRFLRTGNVLFSRRLVADIAEPFDPRMGRTGGEDADFFGRMVAAGRSFVWCDEARVYEEVPVERQTLRYHVERACIRGVTEADKEARFGLRTLKSMLAALLYAVSLPIFMLTGYHRFARYLVRCVDHVAKLLAKCGIRLVKERTF